jgi:hypothetical protein
MAESTTTISGIVFRPRAPSMSVEEESPLLRPQGEDEAATSAAAVPGVPSKRERTQRQRKTGRLDESGPSPPPLASIRTQLERGGSILRMSLSSRKMIPFGDGSEFLQSLWRSAGVGARQPGRAQGMPAQRAGLFMMPRHL